MVLQNVNDNKIVEGVVVALIGASRGDLFTLDASNRLKRIPFGTQGYSLVCGTSEPEWSAFSVPGGNAGGDLAGSTFPNPVIAPKAVTFAKIQDVPTGVIVGRVSATTGSIETLTPTQTKTLLGLGTAANLNTGISNGNIPVLDSNGKLDTSVVPALRSHEFLQVANSTARLALTSNQVQPGDEAYELDTTRTYKLIATDPSQTASWVLVSDATVDGSEIIGTIPTARLDSGITTGKVVVVGAGDKIPASLIPTVGSFTWNLVTVTSQQMAVSSGYITNNAARVTLTLPTVAAVGDVIEIVGYGGGGWRIAQNASQQIHYLSRSTTVGATGRIDTDNTYTSSNRACLSLMCVVANSEFIVRYGNGTVDVV